MTCASCRDRMDELVRGELPERRAAAVREHLSSCLDCTRFHTELRATLSLLARAGEEPLPSDFAASLHRKLVAAPVPAAEGILSRIGAFFAERAVGRFAFAGVTFVGAAAAMLALGLAGRAYHLVGEAVPSHRAELAASGDVAPIFVVPKTKVAVVRIDFLAEQDIGDVEFAIALPEGLHFVSEGRELPDREFRWRGRLARGSNPIPVAVKGSRAGRYTLAAHAVATDLNASQNVVLEVTSG